MGRDDLAFMTKTEFCNYISYRNYSYILHSAQKTIHGSSVKNCMFHELCGFRLRFLQFKRKKYNNKIKMFKYNQTSSYENNLFQKRAQFQNTGISKEISS